MYGLSLDGWKRYRKGVCTKGFLVVAGIVRSWGCAANPKKRVGNAVMVAWSLIGKTKANMKDFHAAVGTVNTLRNVVAPKKKDGNATTAVE